MNKLKIFGLVLLTLLISSFAYAVVEDNPYALGSTTPTDAIGGMKIFTYDVQNLVLTNISKHPDSTALTAYLQDENHTVLTSGSFVGDIFELNYSLDPLTTYYVVVDANGAAYDQRFTSSGVSYPQTGTYINWTAGTRDNFPGYGDESTVARSIDSLGITVNATTNFSITAIDQFDSSAITIFNATVDGNFYETTNGTVVTDFLTNETSLLNITVQAEDYEDFTNEDYNVSFSGNLEAQLSAGTIFFNATQLFTKDTVVGNFTFNSQTKETGETFTRPVSGTYNVTFSREGYYDKTDTINFSNYSAGYYTVENVFDAKINITANNTLNGDTINNYTINYNSSLLSLDSSETTTSGLVTLNLIQGYNYTFEINATGFALDNDTFSLNYSNTYNFELFTENSLNINIYDEISRELINGTNITVEVIGATTNTFITSNGTLYVDFLTPSDYELRYFSTDVDDYKLRSTFLTVSEQSTQDINLYLLNESDTGITTATITFQVFGSDLSAVEDATVIVSRFYPALNSYVDVWQRKTTASGVAIGEFETIDAFYQYRVLFGGETKFTSSNSGIQFNADDTIDIFIDTETSLYNDFQTLGDISFTPINFTQTSNTTGTFFFSYSSDSSVTVCLDVQQTSFSGLSTNSTCVTSTGGTLFLPVTSSNYETTFLAKASIKVSDELGFQEVDSLTKRLNGLNEPTDSDAWKSNLAWVAVLLTMISAVLFISVNPTVALLFQSITFAAIAFSPIQIIGDLQAAAVVLICIVLLIINARRSR